MMETALTSLAQDLRYALRQLRNAPGFTLTAILTLALGIGVATTVFSVVRQVLLTPLPYTEPQRLVGVAFSWPGKPPNADQTGSSAEFLMRNSHSFAASTVMNGSSTAANLSGKGGHAASIAVLGVSHGYFNTLGASPILGRGFTDGEDQPGGAQALVLSYGLWQRAYGGDPSIVGRTLRLDQENITVVGVMPASFRAEAYSTQTTVGSPDAWRPLQLSPKDPGYIGDNYKTFARLRPGVTLAQAQAEMQALDPAFYREHPNYKAWKNRAGQNQKFRVWPLAAVLAGNVHDSLIVMAWATTAVLLLTCLNLAGLNTARALRRSPEFALRAALGATRGRLIRLALLEAGVLTLAGVAGVVLIVRLLLPFLLKASPVPIPQLNGAAGFWMTAAQATTVGLLSALLFGAPLVIAALQQGRALSSQNNRSASGTTKQASAGRLLVVLQISLAVILVSASSLLLGTFLKLRALPLGFEPQKLVVFQTNLKGERYAMTRTTAQFTARVLASLRQSPGVRSAAAISGLPLDSGLNMHSSPQGRSELRQSTEFRAITPVYFTTMGQPLLEGRDLTNSDGPSAMPVIVISATTARRWWPGRSPIGDAIQLSQQTWRIVGVVADAPGRSLAAAPDVFVYAPITQLSDSMTKMFNGWFPTSFAVRLAAQIDTAPIVRKAVSNADPEIPIAKLTTMQQVIDTSVATPRFFTQLAECFGAFAMLLTAIGLFGLLSYQVAQRTREIGVRMALGASRENIVRNVLADSGRLALIGCAAGALGSLLLQPLLTHWIAQNVIGLDSMENSPASEAHKLLFNSTAALCVSVAALALTTLAATLLPARKAALVEPMEALRSE